MRSRISRAQIVRTTDPGIGDDQINAASLREKCGRIALHRGVIAHIDRLGDHHGALRLTPQCDICEAIATATDQPEIHAGLGIVQGKGFANTGRGTRNDYFHIIVHRSHTVA